MIYINRLPKEFPSEIGIDIETSSLDPFSGRILSVCLSDGTDTWLFTRDFKRLVPVLKAPTVTKIAHNASFDMKWLQVHLNTQTEAVFDTLLAERVLNMGKQQPNDLKFVLAHRFGLILDKEIREEFYDHPGFDIQPMTTEQFDYIVRDVEYLPRLKAQQLADISQKQLGKVLKLELEVLPIIIKMEIEGVRCDSDLWDSYVPIIEGEISSYDQKMREYLGEDYTISIPGTHKKEPVLREKTIDQINLASPSQMTAILDSLGIQVTDKNGKQTTNEKALARWAEDNQDHPHLPFLDLLFEYRHWNKVLGWNYPKYINPVTGKVHPSWNQLGTNTGRQSCSDPNMQNVERPVEGKPNLRKLWVSDSPDYVIIGVDYSQQEPRIFAHLCQDPLMIAACNTEDVYIEFAKYMYGTTIDKSSHERYIAKQFVLAVAYGAGAAELHRTSGLPLKECNRIRSIIRDSFPTMIAWSQEQYRRVKTYGHTRTAIGRIRYLTTAFDKTYSNSVNSPVQGTAADMTKEAMVRCHNYIQREKLDARIWISVHDEIEIHAPITLAETMLPAIINEMEIAGKEICPSVLHIAEGKIYGAAWNK